MTDQALRTLVTWGLQALKSGAEMAKAATAELERDAKHPDLKSALQAGSEISAQWAQRIDRALAEAGEAKDVGNPVLQAHYEFSRQIRQSAPDDLTRDLGIITAGQLAHHYWIASFGTLRTYASALGMSRTEQDMQACLDEAKQSDQQQTELMKKLLDARGKVSLAA